MTEAKQIVIIGAGIAGLTAALELARMGVRAYVVEKGPFFGGHAAHFACKATDRCLKCNNCLVEACLKEISDEKSIRILTGTYVQTIARNGKRFNVALHSQPPWIDPEKCTDCGLCYEKCPEVPQGAMLMAPSHHIHPFYAIDRDYCTHSRGKVENICQSVCPEGAIDLDKKEATLQIEADGIILATGYDPFDPEQNKRFNFSRFRNMVTGMDLEKMLRTRGQVFRPSNGDSPETLAFIQCVGSRDVHLNRDYCSRVCCGYALRMALRIAHEHPEIQTTFFYMDIQNFGKDFDRYYRQAKNSIRLIRGMPGDFYASDNERILLSYYDEAAQKQISEVFDMVVLSVGMSPGTSNPHFKDMLGLKQDEDGFLLSPDETGDNGIVVAGSAEGPMDITETITHAKRAALEMARHLGIVGK